MANRRQLPPTGILQSWVATLGLRHQGVLLAVVRGCDTVPKEDPAKALTRALRGWILNTHCADPSKAVSFIETVEPEEFLRRFEVVARSFDHYPAHFVFHMLFAIEVVGYHHPEGVVRCAANWAYVEWCRRMHVGPEPKEELDRRLGLDEDQFGGEQ